jgi:2-(1,2-epoxy-1,2-dihydrophenyl)acetyl-CoA isomerase
LAAAIAEVHATPGLKALTLRGAGGYFCVGGDLQALASGTSHATGSGKHVLDLLRHEQAVIRDLVALPVLTIALIEGAAAGGGLDLALACDLRVSTPAAKLAASFVRRGLVPDLGGLYLLRRVVPHPVAARLALTGEVVDGREAYRTGLVQALGDDVAAAQPFLDSVAEASPYALGRAKDALVRPDLVAGLNQANEMAATQAVLLREPEFQELLTEFLARRAARSGTPSTPGTAAP